MIAATAATRATIAAPPAKGAPTLAGGDFALAIAEVFDGGGNGMGEAAPAGSTDPSDADRQGDADGGTTLPGAAPTLDIALSWLPFAPIEAAAVAVIDDRATQISAPTAPTATVGAAMPASRSIGLAPPVIDIAEPRGTIVAAPIPSTNASAIATSSLTPVPVVVPRTGAAPAAPTAASGMVDPDPLPVQTAIGGAVLPPPPERIDASPISRAAYPAASANNAPRVAASVDDPFATAAAAMVSGTTVAAASDEPATVAVPTRFRPGSPAVAVAATPAPATTDPVTASPMVGSPIAVPADRPPAVMPTLAVATAGAQPIATPSAASPATMPPIAVPVVVPPLPTVGPLAPTVTPAVADVGIGPAAADTIIVAATAPVPIAPAAFLRQIGADTLVPAAALAVVVPDPVAAAPASSGVVFGAAIRAAASAGEDKPALVATDPLAPVATPVAEVRSVAATTSAQQAPLDMSQPRWPHAMIERIDQLRDAINAVDTRIRLIPDALGQIDVSIRQDGDTTHVTFAAEQAATRTMLQDAAPRLAAIAEERGVKLGQSTTDTGQQPPSQQRQAAQQSATNRAPVSTHADRDAVTDDGDGRVA